MLLLNPYPGLRCAYPGLSHDAPLGLNKQDETPSAKQCQFERKLIMKLQKMLSVICVLSALCGMSWAGEAVKSQNTQVVSNTTDVCFYPFFSGGSITNPGGSIFHVSVFTMPFAKAWNVSKNTFTQDDTVNPFVFSESKDNADGPFMEQPLCCLYSEVDINPATSPAATASSVMARRWRLVDTCVLRVWQLETWGKGKYGHWTFLNPQPLDLALLDVETGAKKNNGVCFGYAAQ